MGETEKNNPEKNVIYKYDALIRMNIWEQQGSKTRSPHYSKKTLKHYGANTNTRLFLGHPNGKNEPPKTPREHKADDEWNDTRQTKALTTSSTLLSNSAMIHKDSSVVV